MSTLQICDLNSHALNEINEQETKQVVGGFFNRVFVAANQNNTQIGFNILTISGSAIGVGVGQTVNNNATNSIVAIA